MSSSGKTVTLSQALEAALQCLKAGQLPQAEAIYRQVLQADPVNAVAPQFLGVIAQQRGDSERAVEWFGQALRARPDYHQAHGNLGIALQKLGRLEEAIASYRRALELKPDYAEAASNLGDALLVAGDTDGAVSSLREALRIRPGNAHAHHNLGNALKALEHLDEAATHYRRALELKPDFAGAANNLGGVLHKMGRFAEAEQCYLRVFELAPREAEAHFNLGMLSQERADPEAAARRYREAIELDPKNAGAHNNLGNLLRGEGRLDEAEACYRAALAVDPDHAQARNNLGNVLRDRGRLDEAKEWYARALETDAGPAEAYVNMAGVLRERERPQEAARWLARALAARPDFAEAHYNLGNLMQEQGRREEAIACFRRALETKPDYPEALAGLLHQLQHVCDWSQLDELTARVRNLINGRDDARIPPFAMLAVDLSPAEQLRCASNWARLGYEPLAALRPKLGFAFHRAAKPKLRVGYLSGDFRAHPVAYLCSGLLELHDRARFEVHGYSCGPEDGSATRARMVQACDRFTDVRALSYEDAARAIHADGIDILVDLAGYTQWGRPGILALRPAPVQVNFLGFPGTLGAEFADYLIADDFLVPPEQARYYAEKIAGLPSFQPNDHQRPRPGAATRGEHGLPRDALVFCCFNQTFKIAPPVFDIWMRVLAAAQGAVLWLTRSNARVEANLRAEAARRGVDPQRLVFAPWIQDDLARHYARVALADLFLDTWPFNAGATASDALWCGVPVLTCAGETFVSRAAGSLLTALGLPDLVACTPEEYERRALALARDPQALAALRARLAQNRGASLLFDTGRYVRHLERAYRTMWEKHLAGEPPGAFHVAADT